MDATDLNQWNFSDHPCLEQVQQTPLHVFYYFSAAAVVLLTVCGNLLVIISISHFKLLHTPTNLLILSLAVADLLVGVTVMPFSLALLIETLWYFGSTVCVLYKVFSFLLTCVSIFNVVFIAVDRYLALCHPFLYATKITVDLIFSGTVLIWLFSITYNMVLLYFNHNISNDAFNTTCAEECFVKVNAIWAIVDLLCVLILPCILITILYLKIFLIARSHAMTIRCERKRANSKLTTTKSLMASETKAAQKIVILLLIFILCLIPSFIMDFVDPKGLWTEFQNMAICFLIFNSTINPILYALLYPWFKRCVKLIVTFKICSSGSSLINVLADHS